METLLGILFAILSLFGLGQLVTDMESGGFEAAPSAEATPAPVESQATPTQFIMVEHGGNNIDLDLGEPGPSAGDMTIWGPNPLYDEFDISDTGATTQGTCLAINAAEDCLTTETIVFPDGSTLELQGFSSGTEPSSTRTIVGGSGQYLGAIGTVTVEPSADRLRWTKTFEIWM
jgi:hypothetical protein